MRDQMDAMLWNEHHDQFSEWLDGVVHAAGRGLRNGGAALARRVPAQAYAAALAFGLTLATLGASTA